MFNKWGDSPFFYKDVSIKLQEETARAPKADATPNPIPLVVPGYN